MAALGAAVTFLESCADQAAGSGDPSRVQPIDIVQHQRDSLERQLSRMYGLVSEVGSGLGRIQEQVLAADSSLSLFRIQSRAGSPEGSEDPLRESTRERIQQLGTALSRFESRAKRAERALDSVRRSNVALADAADSMRVLIRRFAALATASQRELEELRLKFDAATALTQSLSDERDVLRVSLDSAVAENATQATALRAKAANDAMVFLAIGKREELVSRRIARKVFGGLAPASTTDSTLFRRMTRDEVRYLRFPNPDKRYRIVSAQDLRGLTGTVAAGTDLRGGLQIRDPDQFWAPSRFLILWER